MPEEGALTIVSHALSAVRENTYSKDYTIVRMRKYEAAPTIDGVAPPASRSKSAVALL